MIEAGIGRLLVASLHQAIADLLPTRLEFYEAWLNPTGLRDGRIGLAPLAAVLSFLRLEGAPYRLVAARAGEYSAEWWVADMPAYKRTVIRSAPAGIRVHLVLPGSSGETQFRASAATRLEGIDDPAYGEFMRAAIARMQAMTGPGTRSQDVAEAVWRAATDSQAPFRIPAGADAVQWAAEAAGGGK